MGDAIGVDTGEDEVVQDETGVGELDAWEDADDCVPSLPPLPEGTPGDDTWLTSCVPSAIGPLGWAGQLPGGFKGAVWPNGIVPWAPTWALPKNILGLTP
jgi:hypothetical protein